MDREARARESKRAQRAVIRPKWCLVKQEGSDKPRKKLVDLCFTWVTKFLLALVAVATCPGAFALNISAPHAMMMLEVWGAAESPVCVSGLVGVLENGTLSIGQGVEALFRDNDSGVASLPAWGDHNAAGGALLVRGDIASRVQLKPKGDDFWHGVSFVGHLQELPSLTNKCFQSCAGCRLSREHAES